MKKEDFFEVLGELDDDIVKGVKLTMKENSIKRSVWVKWTAAAACLCLAVGAAVLLRQGFSAPPDKDSPPADVAGGGAAIGDGGEGMMYSVAVYPADESEKNVKSADVASLTEKEALENALANHLPRQLPDGFHYGRGSIYNTVMKDGTQYNMLRVEYISGTIPKQEFAEDGGAVVPNMDLIGDVFIVCVMNYEPDTDIDVYSSCEEVSAANLEENRAAYIRVGDCYVGVFTETAEPTVVFEVLGSIE